MGTRTAGHPSRAFSQWDNHNIWARCYTLTHTYTQYIYICSMQRHTLSWLLLICFLLCCCVTAPSGSNSRSGLLVQMRSSSLFSLLVLQIWLFYFFSLLRLRLKRTGVDSRSDVRLCFFCPCDFDEWQKANLFVVLHAVSSCDNHILTVQMRKWLIGLVINIMSYYPGQVEELFHQARLYLSFFTYAPVLLISQRFIASEITVFFH